MKPRQRALQVPCRGGLGQSRNVVDAASCPVSKRCMSIRLCRTRVPQPLSHALLSLPPQPYGAILSGRGVSPEATPLRCIKSRQSAIRVPCWGLQLYAIMLVFTNAILQSNETFPFLSPSDSLWMCNVVRCNAKRQRYVHAFEAGCWNCRLSGGTEG